MDHLVDPYVDWNDFRVRGIATNMEDRSIFMDKLMMPSKASLETHLGINDKLWKVLENYVFEKYPKGLAEWNYPGKKYGWSYRIKDKKRAIIYFLPREGYFKVAFVFGQKAYDTIMRSNISEEIKVELQIAKKYAEGRGVRIDIHNKARLNDIFQLIDIKMAH